MTEVVFYIFAAIAVLSGALCILQRSPMASALWLVSTMFSLAAIYVLLNAQFIAAIQERESFVARGNQLGNLSIAGAPAARGNRPIKVRAD